MCPGAPLADPYFLPFRVSTSLIPVASGEDFTLPLTLALLIALGLALDSHVSPCPPGSLPQLQFSAYPCGGDSDL